MAAIEEPPVVSHVELCVEDSVKTISILQKFGFNVFAKRETKKCKQFALRLGANIIFVVNERAYYQQNGTKHDVSSDFPAFICCEDSKTSKHSIDTVFNVAFNCRNVHTLTKRIASELGAVILSPTSIVDRDGHGSVIVSAVRSICGNVIHTLIQKVDYTGPFLPGFIAVEDKEFMCEDHNDVLLQDIMTHIDHVTLAVNRGESETVLSFYEKCFGMKRFNISSDESDEGLILADSIGIKLKAMEYFRCAETGLIYPSSSANRERKLNSLMLVVVESLPGQADCQIDNFLREHSQPGVEHIAFSTNNIYTAVSLMTGNGCTFRKPPRLYYSEIVRKMKEIKEDISTLEKFGILLDNESDSPEKNDCPKYLMQIFALPIFSRKTFFIEIIHRSGGARGLGQGNILALVRSIREDEKRKMAESSKKQESEEETSRVC